MEDFYRLASLSEVLFLREVFEIACGERRFDKANCAVAGSCLVVHSGRRFPGLTMRKPRIQKRSSGICDKRGSRLLHYAAPIPGPSRKIDLAVINEEAKELLKAGAQTGLEEALEKCRVQDLAALNALFMSWKPGESLVEVIELVFPPIERDCVAPNGGVE